MTALVKAHTPEHFADAATLIRAYHAYIDTMQFHECIAGDIEEEIRELDRAYPAHKGGIFVAYFDGKPAGCVALEEQSPGIAEIRRLFVDDAFRGKKIGHQLIAAAVAEAKKLGYQSVRLDTFRAVNFAANIYKDLGFIEIPPYNELPPEKIVFMEQVL
jgi:putative acetyltransferase